MYITTDGHTIPNLCLIGFSLKKRRKQIIIQSHRHDIRLVIGSDPSASLDNELGAVFQHVTNCVAFQHGTYHRKNENLTNILQVQLSYLRRLQ